jgi:hypothetical protein
MQWWNDFVDWVTSDEGWRVISTTVIPFVAIVVAGLIAALIGRGSARRIIALTERDRRVAAVTSLISAARRASRWNTLSAPEQRHAEHLANEADTCIRLLPLAGTAMAADWAAHEIAAMKKNAVSFSFQAEQSLLEFRDRLVEWQARPSRAKKLFKNDLDSWAYESSVADKDLVLQQQEWAKQQVNETGSIPVVTAGASATKQDEAQPEKTSWPSSRAEAKSGSSSSAPTATPAVPPTAAFAASPPSAPSPTVAEPAAPRYNAPPAAPDVPAYAMPASAPSTARSSADDSSTDTGEHDSATQDAPGPISAGSVRQRINPDNTQY